MLWVRRLRPLIVRARSARSHRRRGRAGHARGGGCGGAGGAAVPAHHSRHGHGGRPGACAAGGLGRPSGGALRLRAAQPGRHRRHDRGVLRVSMIPDEIVEQVRDSADLVGIIGEAVELKRTGSDWRGPCPFHGGTHRNFAVIPKKGLYYCYVCHEAGDVFTFLMKRFGMDYPTAVREIARRAGITIPDRPGREVADPREPLFGASAVAADWFAVRLREAPDAAGARDYIESREFPLPLAAEHGLGYAPSDKSFLAGMRELGVEEQVLI